VDIPGHADHTFRGEADHQFRGHADHVFRGMPITGSEVKPIRKLRLSELFLIGISWSGI
jgi:hypothetical protein